MDVQAIASARLTLRADLERLLGDVEEHRLDAPDGVEPKEWAVEFAFDGLDVMFTRYHDGQPEIEIPLANGSRIFGWLEVTNVVVDEMCDTTSQTREVVAHLLEEPT